jgi:hypothetical protein
LSDYSAPAPAFSQPSVGPFAAPAAAASSGGPFASRGPFGSAPARDPFGAPAGGGAGEDQSIASIKGKIVDDFTNDLPLWPFSCYSYQPFKPNVLNGDVSPEELRWEAYQHRAQYGSIEGYNQNWRARELEMQNRRQQLANDPLAFVAPSVASPTTFTPVADTMDDRVSAFGGPEPQQLSDPFRANVGALFKPGNTTPPGSPLRSAFGEATPPPRRMPSLSALPPPPPPVVPAVDTSSIKDVSAEDLEAFKASEFVFGKIPEVEPPPQLR